MSQDDSEALDSAEDLNEAIKDFCEQEKLGHGFTPVDPLEEIDIGKGDRSRPTFVSKNLLADYKIQLIELLKECNVRLTRGYREVPVPGRTLNMLIGKPNLREFL